MGVNGQWYNVEYEGLHIICAQCGCYVHLLEDCPVKPKVTETVVVQAGGDSGDDGQGMAKSRNLLKKNSANCSTDNDNHKEDIFVDAFHGDCLVVKTKKRGNKANINATKIKDFQTQKQSSGFEIFNEFNAEIDGRPSLTLRIKCGAKGNIKKGNDITKSARVNAFKNRNDEGVKDQRKGSNEKSDEEYIPKFWNKQKKRRHDQGQLFKCGPSQVVKENSGPSHLRED